MSHTITDAENQKSVALPMSISTEVETSPLTSITLSAHILVF